jgi:mono/diheme cytochrome c family protein
MFKRVVDAVEYVVLVAAAATVVLLLVYRPGGSSGSASSSGSPASSALAASSPEVRAGAPIFARNCASCHGAGGEGGIGARLRFGAVVNRYPRVEDEVAVVTDGRSGMPAWGGRLTPDEIRAVVAYTREGLK